MSVTVTFESLGLKDELLQAINGLGFVHPTPIQEKSIPYLLSNNTDLIALAQTGTGKTAAFGLPLLHHINASDRFTQVLVLCPTRELCLQIERDLKRYAANLRDVAIVSIYGGADIRKQLDALKQRPQIIVGTPGRVCDVVNRKALDFSRLRYLVLDEADEMLSMGFQDDLDYILSSAPATKQTLLFSATMPSSINQLTKKYLVDPKEISVGQRNSASAQISHRYCVVHAKDKYLACRHIIDYWPDMYGIIFCRTKIEAKELAELLAADGYNADALHGDLSQAQRDHVMKRFRNKNLQVLVATDVAARGLDVNSLSHVINYNLPDDPEVYVHRSGRTGRAGKEGISIAILHMREVGRLRDIEKVAKQSMQLYTLPSGKEICEQQLLHLVRKIVDAKVNEAEITPYLPAVLDAFKDIDREELVKRLLSVEFNRFLEYYQDLGDINASHQKSSGGYDRSDRFDRSGRFGGGRGEGRGRRDGSAYAMDASKSVVTLCLNVGKKDQLTVPDLLTFVNRNSSQKLQLGRIDLQAQKTMVEVDSRSASQLTEVFEGNSLNGVPLRVTRVEKSSFSGGRDYDRRGGSEDGGKSRFGGGYRSGGYKGRGGSGGSQGRFAADE